MTEIINCYRFALSIVIKHKFLFFVPFLLYLISPHGVALIFGCISLITMDTSFLSATSNIIYFKGLVIDVLKKSIFTTLYSLPYLRFGYLEVFVRSIVIMLVFISMTFVPKIISNYLKTFMETGCRTPKVIENLLKQTNYFILISISIFLASFIFKFKFGIGLGIFLLNIVIAVFLMVIISLIEGYLLATSQQLVTGKSFNHKTSMFVSLNNFKMIFWINLIFTTPFTLSILFFDYGMHINSFLNIQIFSTTSSILFSSCMRFFQDLILLIALPIPFVVIQQSIKSWNGIFLFYNSLSIQSIKKYAMFIVFAIVFLFLLNVIDESFAKLLFVYRLFLIKQICKIFFLGMKILFSVIFYLSLSTLINKNSKLIKEAT